VNFKLTSATVMNSFFIPSVGGQIYTMAGMQTSLSLEVADPGTYQGLSAQFSGDGFSDMHFPVLATDQAEFDAWVNKLKSGGNALDEDAYSRLANVHQTSGIEHFASVNGDIFAYALRQSVSSPNAGGLAPISKTSISGTEITRGMEH
jgi:cytochrome o ubiquinol oxidase subunit 2